MTATTRDTAMTEVRADRRRVFDRPAGRPLLAAVALLLVALYLASIGLPLIGPWPVEPTDPLAELVGLASVLLWATVTLLALVGRDTYRLGWVLVGSALADQIWLLGFIQVHALYFIAENFKGLGTVVTAHVLVAFPTGRLEGRFDGWFIRGLYAYFLVGAVIRTLIWEPGFTCETYCPRNPFALFPNAVALERFDGVTSFAVPIIGLALVLAVWRHWRRARPAGRRVLVPVMIALPIVYAVNSAGYLGQYLDADAVLELVYSTPVQATSMLMPLAMLAGIVSTRLARGNVAALAVEIGRGIPVGALQDVLARALRDPSLVIAYPTVEGGGFVDRDGRAMVLPPSRSDRAVTRLERDEELLAVLIHDPAVSHEDPGLVDGVASVARLALENERLAAQVRAQLEEVRASRQRIVEAADDERRRVERDLHDGAQQRLVALAMRLQLARDTAAGAQTLLDEATAELRAAIAEVRDLARGLHPTILSEAGLAAAVDALAERTPVPVRVSIPERRFPTPVEAAAYFVVAEALTNVVRYARASEARVSATVEGERLVVAVEDDGIGGADPDRGSGLRGLRDRVAAVGGDLSVLSPTGAGTVLRVELPIT